MSDKKLLIARILEQEATAHHQSILMLIKLLIEEARIRNDTAVAEEIYKNQGAIRELKQLLKVIRSHNVHHGYDGGYGE